MTSTKITPPDTTSRRVVRGGSWRDTDPAWVRAAIRCTSAPTRRGNDLGFRTVLAGRVKR